MPGRDSWWALRDNPPPSPRMARLCPRLWQAWVVGLVAGCVLLLGQDIWIYAGWVSACVCVACRRRRCHTRAPVCCTACASCSFVGFFHWLVLPKAHSCSWQANDVRHGGQASACGAQKWLDEVRWSHGGLRGRVVSNSSQKPSAVRFRSNHAQSSFFQKLQHHTNSYDGFLLFFRPAFIELSFHACSTTFLPSSSFSRTSLIWMPFEWCACKVARVSLSAVVG